MAAKMCMCAWGGEGGDLNDTHTDGATEHDHRQYDSSKKYATKDDKQFFKFGKSVIRDTQMHTASTGEKQSFH